MNTYIQIPEDSSARKVAFAIYILNLISFVLPILMIVSVVFAYIFENDTKDYLKSHYHYLVRSFWIGLLYFSIAGLSLLIVIGVVLIPVCMLWWLIRMAKGLKALLRNEPIPNPNTWLF